MINKYLKVIIVLLLVANATFAGNKIGIYDLRYTLQLYSYDGPVYLFC